MQVVFISGEHICNNCNTHLNELRFQEVLEADFNLYFNFAIK